VAASESLISAILLSGINGSEQFRIASGIEKQSEEAQVNTLIYSMGDQTDDIFRLFQLSDEDAKKYNVVKAKFESHFVKKRNVIYERAKFNQCKQEENKL